MMQDFIRAHWTQFFAMPFVEHSKNARHVFKLTKAYATRSFKNWANRLPLDSLMEQIREVKSPTVSTIKSIINKHTVWPLVSKHICFSGLTISSLEHGFIQVMRKHLEQKYLCLVEQAKRGEPHTMRGSVALGYLYFNGFSIYYSNSQIIIF